MNAILLLGVLSFQGAAAAQDSVSAGFEVPKGAVSLAVVLGAIIAMLGGLWFVFARLKDKQQGVGPSALKALGLVLFMPTLLMIAVAVRNFSTETLAALL